MQSAKNAAESVLQSAVNAVASTKSGTKAEAAVQLEKAERTISSRKIQPQLKNTTGMDDYLATVGIDTGDYMTTGTAGTGIGTGSTIRTGTGVGPGAATVTGDSRRPSAPVRADAPRVAYPHGP